MVHGYIIYIIHGTHFHAPDARFEIVCLFSEASTERLEIQIVSVMIAAMANIVINDTYD
jgi:hypothetical protein